ncbi:MAG: type I-E CRISPR-associated protein Cas6/Cse3/CasE [Chloroflexota bacterium]
MYLSRLMLNPQSRQVQRETINPYQMHRTIMRGFAHRRDQASALHRLDVHPRSGAITLLVQSLAEPDWEWLAERDYLLPADPLGGLENPAVKSFDLRLRANQVLNFRLRANPTIKKVRRDERGERRNSNRVPLVHAEQQAAWLERRADENGFRLLQVDVGQSQELVGHKEESGRPITVYTVQFDGRLQVADPARLRQAVAKGIGPAKAFGCGLLSLAAA